MDSIAVTSLEAGRGDKKRLVPCLHALVLFQQRATRGNKGCAVQPDESLLTIMDGPKNARKHQEVISKFISNTSGSDARD